MSVKDSQAITLIEQTPTENIATSSPVRVAFDSYGALLRDMRSAGRR